MCDLCQHNQHTATNHPRLGLQMKRGALRYSRFAFKNTNKRAVASPTTATPAMVYSSVALDRILWTGGHSVRAWFDIRLYQSPFFLFSTDRFPQQIDSTRLLSFTIINIQSHVSQLLFFLFISEKTRSASCAPNCANAEETSPLVLFCGLCSFIGFNCWLNRRRPRLWNE